MFQNVFTKIFENVIYNKELQKNKALYHLMIGYIPALLCCIRSCNECLLQLFSLSVWLRTCKVTGTYKGGRVKDGSAYLLHVRSLESHQLRSLASRPVSVWRRPPVSLNEQAERSHVAVSLKVHT
jgi:hypothetical protein